MRLRPVVSLLCLFVPPAVTAQVLDVDGDGIVGPQEALALAEDWRKGASGGSNNLVLNLTVAPGETISQGDVVSLTTGGLVKGGIVVCALGGVSETPLPETNLLVAAPVTRLSENRFVLRYDKISGGGERLVVGTLVGDSIEFGAPTDLSANDLSSVALGRLSESKFVAAYRDGGDGQRGKVRIGTISGDTITLEGEEVFNDGNTSPISVTGISETRFVVAYRDIPNSSAGTARIGFDHPIQGLLLSPEAVFDSGGIGGSSIAIGALSGTKVLVVHAKGSKGNSVVGTVIIPTPVSVGALTYGATETVVQEPVGNLSSIPLSSSEAALGFSGNMNIGKVQLVTIAGTDVIPGAQVDVSPPNTNFLSLGLMTPDKIVAGFDLGGAGTGAVVTSLAGSRIHVGPGLNNPTTRFHSLVTLGADRVALFDGQDGRAVLAQATPISIAIGIAQGAGTEGQSIQVLASGISEVHSGLTPGSFYFGQPDGSLDTSFTEAPIGIALSPSTLLVGAGTAGP